MKSLLTVMLLVPILVQSQINSNRDSLENKGNSIKWTDGLTWQQIKDKARVQNKYIFLDIYATWCGPCKHMDKEVYSYDSVIDYFNSQFICVKVQMDKTVNDANSVKNWYGDAENIGKQYRIIEFPTYLFLSPKGKLVQKEVGFKSSDIFLKLAKSATIPGKVYKDPYVEYDHLLSNYRRGRVKYEKIPYMIAAAKQLRSYKLADSLVKNYFNYLERLNEKKLYTKKRIEFISSNISNSKSKFFSFFYPDGKKVDELMHKKGYAQATVDKVITQEEIAPAIKEFAKHNTLKMVRAGKEPDWSAIIQIITNKYNVNYAERTVRAERVNFYWMVQNIPAYIENGLLQFQNQELDMTDVEAQAELNNLAWFIFLTINDEKTINTAIHITKGVLERESSYIKNSGYDPMDTYANLLYKITILYHAGRLEDALAWEQKALENAIENMKEDKIKNIRVILEKMKKQEPTWPQ